MSDGFKYVSLFDSKPMELYTFDLEPYGGIACYRNRHDQVGYSAFDLHFELEIGIVLSGTLERIAAGRRARLEAGQIWLHGPWEPHGFRVVTAPCEIVDVVIDPLVLLADTTTDWLAPFLTSPQRRLPTSFEAAGGTTAVPGRASVAQLAISLHDLFSEQGKNSNAWVRHLAKELLLNVLQFCPETGDKGEQTGEAHQRVLSYHQIQPALQRLVDHRARPQRLSSIAAACGMSERSFHRAFRRATGLTFSAFEERVRLRAVVYALRTSAEPIKSIAVRWNFTDTSHLHRWFKQRTGYSPGEFRRRFS